MHKLKLKPIFVYLVLTSLVTLPVLARDNENGDNPMMKREEKPTLYMERKEDRENIKEQRQENKEERVKARCQIIGDRVDLKVTRYDQNRELFAEKYSNLSERISAWLDRVEKDGYDVADLRSALKTLSSKIADLKALDETFKDKLENLKNYECGNSNGEYASALAEAKKALLDIRESVMDIRKYFIEEVRPLIQDLRDQIKKDRQDDKESSESKN